MQTEKSQNPALSDEPDMVKEEQKDNSLSWLLDQELTETSDSLFSVALDDSSDLELTEAEAMMASRPLVRGSNDTEVLSAFVEEEIVIGSVGDSSDIYSGASREQEAVQAESAADQMIVDHGSQRKATDSDVAGRKVAGDILGLRDDDDMGERHLMIKRAVEDANKPSQPETASTAPALESVETSAVANAAAVEASPLLPAAPEREAQAASNVAEDDLHAAPLGDMSEPLEVDDTLEASGEEELSLEIDELGLEEASQDDEDLSAIDYHVDFEASREDASAIVSTVTPLLGQLVAALQDQVDRRIESLGLSAADSLELNCTLATDESTVEQSIVDGFVDITDFTPELPGCLAGLDQNAVGAIRVRLANTDDAGNWNALLHDDFEIPVAGECDDGASVLPPIEFESIMPANDELSGEVSDVPEAELPMADSVFSDEEIELLGGSEETGDAIESADDHAGSFALVSADTTADAVVDLDAIAGNDDTVSESPFGSLDDNDDWSMDADASGEHAVADSEFLGFDEFIEDEPKAGLNELVDAGGDDLLSMGESFDSDTEEEAQAPVEDTESVSSPLHLGEADSLEPEAAEQYVEIEDIFGEDLDEELGFDAPATDTDVDALLDSLDMGVEPTEADLVGALAMAEPEPVNAPIAESIPTDETVAEDSDEDATAPAPLLLDDAPAGAVKPGPWCIPESIEFSYTSASGAEIFADFLDAFIEEGAMEVEKLEDAISLWERDIASEDAYAPVPRILHTLKGIAKGVGLQRYGTLIHNFETLLEKLERPSQSESADYFRIVNAWLDATVRGFESVETGRVDVDSEFPLVEGRDAEPAVEVETRDAPTEQEKVAAKSDEKQVADEGAKALAAQQTIRLSVDAVDHLMNLTNQAQQLGVRSSQGTVRGKMALAELQGRLSSVRSHIARIADRALMNVTARGGALSSELDALEMDQYSELQEAANILREGVEDLSELIQMTSRQNAMVEALLKQQNSVMSSLRSAIQAARVIPVSRLMPGLRRIVRTVGADLGKDVAFRVLNETGKLDRDNYNRCQVILEHMVRNALDHGIEDAESRSEAGKPRTGKIAVDVGKDGGDYLIRLSDDGRGMDPEVIRETAYRKGLDVDLEAMSDADVLRLIFHKGFSTAASVSEVSGRGVGMEIVLSELQAIGGSIDIDSTVGEGTTFTIRIPSNVTANGALLVSAGEHSYAIPLDGLVAVEHVPVEAFFGAIENNEALDLFSLQCEPAYLATLCHGEKMPDRKTWSSTIPVIVAGDGDHYMAIAIDDVEQALELVIRTLGSQFGKVPGLAGGATTADGRAIVALDLNALVGSLAAHGAKRIAMADEQPDDMLVMVVDDSRTQRLVATSKFDSLGVETVTAENGMAAIDLLNASHRLPDVILLDVEMPVKDGIQTLKELRKSPRYGDIPVIMVTSRTGAKHRKMAADAGCNGYMGKPFNFPLLVQDINKLTGRQLSVA